MLAGYYLSALFTLPDITLDNIGSQLLCIVSSPFPIGKYLNSNTGVCILSTCILWLVVLTTYMSNNKNYMFGKEYGSADWADIVSFNKKFADWDESGNKKVLTTYNRILTQSARISYDSSKTLLNNNQVVIGGSGSGKTAFFVSPNLLQFHASNIYTDPNGYNIGG